MHEISSKDYLQETVNIFLEKNNIKYNCEDHYVKNFKQKVGRFLAQPLLKDNSEVKNILLQFIREYRYYSKFSLEESLKNFYSEILCNKLKLKDFNTFYSPIPSEKDVARENSSNFYLTKFLEVNSLESNVVVNLNSLNLLYENEKLKGRLHNETTAYKKLFYMKNVVLIDDFSGSGKTIKTFLRKNAVLIKDKKIILYVFHLTKNAKTRIIQAFSDNGYSDYQIHCDDISDNIFIHESFNEYEPAIENFEKNIINSDRPLGFDKCGSLVTFFRNCPNNTLSSYWYTENHSWRPLFPRKESKLDFFGKGIVAAKNNILYNLAKYIPNGKRETYDVKEVIILLYLKESNYGLDTFELSRLLGYNNIQLQEHLNLMESDGLIYNHLLTDSAISLLKDLKIYNYTLRDLSNDEVFEYTDQEFNQDSLFIPSKKN
jgi:hypoxanthine phosphoribosyltransferase